MSPARPLFRMSAPARRAPLCWVVGCGLLLLLGACGETEGDGTATDWQARGDAAFRAGDELFASAENERLPEVRSEAVAAWVEAANAYIFSFRLEDPVPARRTARAMLAFRAGRALSKACRQGVTHPYRGTMAERALAWFAEAHALEPTLRAAHFERAVLRESEIDAVRDLRGARRAYARYVRETRAAAPEPSEQERQILERARARMAALEALLGPDEPGRPRDD